MMRFLVRPSALLTIGLLVSTACSSSGDRAAEERERPSPALADAAPPPAPIADGRPLVVMLGDSLTAGLGLDPRFAYPTLIQEKVDAAGLKFRVVNAGISGDTSAGGLSRVDLALEGDVRVMLVAMGGNDA